MLLFVITHKIWVYTEEKAKVVTAAWGTELIQIPAMIDILHQDDLKKGDEFVLFFILSLCNSSYSSYRPSAIHPVLQIVLLQNSVAIKLIEHFGSCFLAFKETFERKGTLLNSQPLKCIGGRFSMLRYSLLTNFNCDKLTTNFYIPLPNSLSL